MRGFFEPSPSVWPDQAEPVSPPPWTGRPQGPPLGAAVSELLLARSKRAAVYVDYVDAYPEGFELEIRASASVAYHELAREGGGSGPDAFGRHWPMAGERRDVLPPQLLRIGVQFADGRTATNIGGHDRPVGGPVIVAWVVVVAAAAEERALSSGLLDLTATTAGSGRPRL